MTWRRLAVVAVLVATGCGGDPPVAAPVPVSSALVPAKLHAGELGVYENTTPVTKRAFANLGQDALISDGRIWEIRRDDRLIATLEIATVKPEVNLARSSVRLQFTRPILAGDVSDIRLAGQEVSRVATSDGKTTMVWFGKGLFEVLQVKDRKVTAADLCQELIVHQQKVSAWEPIPDLFST